MAERFILTPINPFTRRQAQVVQGILDGKSAKEIGRELGISPWTVHNLKSGFKHQGARSQLGIYGVVETITDRGRPKNRITLLSALEGDVVLKR